MADNKYRFAISPFSENRSLLTVYTSGAQKLNDDLILAVFEDGMVIQSENAIGGPPFLLGHLSRNKMDHLHQVLDSILSSGIESQSYLGPDASYTTIVVADPETGKVALGLSSWHELYEVPGKIVASQNGLVALEGRTPNSVKDKWSRQYAEFRKDWDILRNLIQQNDLENTSTISSTKIKF